MDVVYFFSESEAVKVPFYDYDPVLFRQFILHGGGKWDKARQEFIFRRDVNLELLCGASSIPCVFIDEDLNIPPKIFGFYGQSWEKKRNTVSGKNAETVKIDPQENNYPRNKSSVQPINNNQPLNKNQSVINNNPFDFPQQHSLPEKLSEHWRNKLEAELRSRKYSLSTQKAYIYFNCLICRTLQKTPEEIRPDDVTEFLALMEKDKDYSSSAMNLAVSAIKFFFRNVLKNDDISERHRPRRDRNLPMVLSREEISKILGAEKNPKHRLLLMLVYSSGLRVSEVVALKKEHIDLSRKVIFVKLGKGRKDRSTLLSEKAAQFIEEYYEFFGIEKWLFPGYPPTRHLSIRSAQQLFDKAVRRAGITKKITIHGLRHTFATHLLESGTDIRYIQTLLGHANLRTTERYTHVARRSVLNIKSPLDTI